MRALVPGIEALDVQAFVHDLNGATVRRPRKARKEQARAE
jgi:hypothetical protein